MVIIMTRPENMGINRNNTAYAGLALRSSESIVQNLQRLLVHHHLSAVLDLVQLAFVHPHGVLHSTGHGERSVKIECIKLQSLHEFLYVLCIVNIKIETITNSSYKCTHLVLTTDRLVRLRHYHLLDQCGPTCMNEYNIYVLVGTYHVQCY